MNNPTTEIKERLQRMISENPNRMLGELAGQLGVSADPSSLVLPQVKKAVLGRVESCCATSPASSSSRTSPSACNPGRWTTASSPRP